MLQRKRSTAGYQCAKAGEDSCFVQRVADANRPKLGVMTKAVVQGASSIPFELSTKLRADYDNDLSLQMYMSMQQTVNCWA